MGIIRTSLLVFVLVFTYFGNVFGDGDTNGYFSFVDTAVYVSETPLAHVILNIKRTGGKAGDVYVGCKIINSTRGVDFLDIEDIQPINNNIINGQCSFNVIDDDIPEGNETFVIELSVRRGGGVVQAPFLANITILANDKAYGVIGFTQSDMVTIPEPNPSGSSILPIKISRVIGSYGPVSVDWKFTGGPNAGSDDFLQTFGIVSFSDGQSEANFQIQSKADNIPENDETFTLKLTSVSGGAELNASFNELQVRIPANDAPVRFPVMSLTVPENTTNMTVQVFRGLEQDGQTPIGSVQESVIINWYVIPGNARPGSDYQDRNGTITFGSGTRKQDIVINLINDNVPELSENFTIHLEASSHNVYIIPPGVATVTILPSDDQHGVILFGQFTRVIDEDGSRFGLFNVNRSAGTFGAVTVAWEIVPKSPADLSMVFEITSGTLNFAEGELVKSISIAVKVDLIPEEAKEYYIQLSNVTGGARLGNTQEAQKAVFFVADSDSAYGITAFADKSQQKILQNTSPRQLKLTITRSGGTLQTVSVKYTVEYYLPGSSSPSSSLGLTSPGSISLGPGQSSATFTITISADGFIKLGSVFKVQLQQVQLAGVTPLVPAKTPRLGFNRTLYLNITADDANGEVGFAKSHQTVKVTEPVGPSSKHINLLVMRDGTAGRAMLTWTISTTSVGFSPNDTGPTSGIIVFEQGQNAVNITIEIMPDDTPELDEIFTVTLSNVSSPNRLQTGMEVATVTIAKNDNPGGTFNFESVTPLVLQEGSFFSVTVVRHGSALDKRCVTFRAVPDGSSDFSNGGTKTFIFSPHQMRKNAFVEVKKEGTPELDEVFSLVLLPSEGSACDGGVVGNQTVLNVTITKNDDPYGIIGFVAQHIIKHINETRQVPNVVRFEVDRERGAFGSVTVSWQAVSTSGLNASLDISPISGVLNFAENTRKQYIEINVLHDLIPEKNESFIIHLTNVTGGALLNSKRVATLTINKNDDPIYIDSPIQVNISEGQSANFTIRRGGDGDSVVIVTYSTVDGTAKSPSDYTPAVLNRVTFGIGEFSKTISVHTIDDITPEGVEEFTVQLINATGDTVLYPNHVAIISIYASDAGTGEFEFAANSLNKSAIEGSSVSFEVARSIDTYGVVHVFWQVFQVQSNGSLLSIVPGKDISQVSGYAVFGNRQSSQTITLHSLDENTAEINEKFALRIINATGIDTGENGRLGNSTTAYLTILANDDPNGLFLFSSASRDVKIPEDFLPGYQNTTVKNLTVLRNQGAWGTVEVVWEIFTAEEAVKLPTTYDLLFLGNLGAGVLNERSKRRQRTTTHACCFSSTRGDSYVSIPLSGLVNDISISAWLRPSQGMFGYVLSYSAGGGIGYAIAVNTTGSTSSISFRYLANSTTVVLGKDIANDQWHFVVITINPSTEAKFYLDGNNVAGSTWSLPSGSVGTSGVFIIGGLQKNVQGYTGCIQDIRVYNTKLEDSLITLMSRTISKLDPINGYLNFVPGVSSQEITVQTVDDANPEKDKTFLVKLLTPKGGARLDDNHAEARLAVLKSDNANGLFRFNSILPTAVIEQNNITKEVRRNKGVVGSVTLRWGVFKGFHGTELATQDFLQPSGTLVFAEGEQRKNLEVYLNNDKHPELGEHFVLRLISVSSSDGLEGSTPTSGASLETGYTEINITIRESDYPYGLLQFMESVPSGNGTIQPATAAFRKDIRESIGTLVLNVVRAQGVEGRVTCPWRIDSITARPPADFIDKAGTLVFEPGVRIASIDITITDDNVPELNKTFLVVLYSPTGGAVLNSATSVANINILPSDDAFGVLNFSMDSVSRTVKEDTSVSLTVLRSGGTLGRVTVYWRAIGPGNQDLETTSGFVDMSIGQQSVNIVIRIAQDSLPELSESYIIELVNVTLGRLASNGTKSNLTILPSDDPYGVFQFNPSSISVLEQNTTVTLTVERYFGAKGVVRVYYRTLDAGDISENARQQAVSGQDYQPITGFLDFADGQINATVNVTLLDDQNPEAEEVLLVNLTRLQLLRHPPVVPVPTDSPRLGRAHVAEVKILKNDDANGILQLTARSVTVQEPYSKAIVNVTRTAGSFGEVTVFFQVIDGTANSSDYKLLFNNVTLREGQRIASVPVQIVNEDTPEHAETFTIRLVPSGIQGGAVLGSPLECVVTIAENDYPYGLIGFHTESLNKVVVEAAAGLPNTRVILRVQRRFGQELSSTVHWEARYNGQLASSDVSPTSGDLVFPVSGSEKTISLEILHDDKPETPESLTTSRLLRVIQVNLTAVTSGKAVLDLATKVANLTIAANDAPHGIIQFTDKSYTVVEGPDSNVTMAYLGIKRDFGTFGDVRVFYSTTAGSGANHAQPNRDFIAVTNASVVIPSGQSLGNISIAILNDSIPELGETFVVVLEHVELVGGQTGFNPKLGSQRMANVTIVTNDDAHGLFVIEAVDSDPGSHGTKKTVLEQDNLAVTFNIKRLGGTIGTVTVEWTVAPSSNASRGSDYSGDGASVAFNDGETEKTASIVIKDDREPERDESLVILLTNPTAGAHVITGQGNNLTIIIGANDGVAGRVGFSRQSQSVVTREGATVVLAVDRSTPAAGQVVVHWRINGVNASLDFEPSTGLVTFSEGEQRANITFHVRPDAKPEPDEIFTVVLTNITTYEIAASGKASLIAEQATATISVQASDEPHGTVEFQTGSRRVITTEDTNVTLVISRLSGTIGDIRVHYETKPGNVTQLDQQTKLATAGEDFKAESGSILIRHGQSVGEIPVQIIDENIPEQAEVFIVNITGVELITSPHNTSEAPPMLGQHVLAQVTISPNDDPRGVIGFAHTRIYLNETTGAYNITILRSQGTLGEVSVQYFVAHSSTANPLDYTIPAYSGGQETLVFADGQREQNITVYITDDAIPEDDESLIIILRTGAGALLVPGKTQTEVIISVNDDARGVFRFSSDSVSMVVSEPGNGINNQAMFKVIRNIQSLGVVFVRWNVLNSTASTDLSPVNGTLEFGAGVSLKSFTVQSLVDSDPEKAEVFVIQISIISGGGRVTMPYLATLTIAENDYPYGELEIISSQTSATTVQVEEDIGVINAKIIRNKGNLGRITVDYRTIPDTASSSSGDVAYFETLQGIKTTGAKTFHAFSAYGDHYLVMASNSSGDMNGYRGTTLFRWQGVYVPLQELKTNGAVQWDSFAFNSYTYLAVANRGAEGRLETHSSVYRLDANGQLTLIQNISTEGASDVKFFNQSGESYLVVANQENNAGLTLLKTKVYKWQGSAFVEQGAGIETRTASGLATFTINSATMLAISFYQNSLNSGFNTKSAVYKWEAGSFRLIQEVDTVGPVGVEYFSYSGQHYLVFVNSKSSSKVYKWRTDKFLEVQSLPTSSIKSARAYHSNGKPHLVTVEGEDVIKVYSWNTEATPLQLQMNTSLSGVSSVQPVVIGEPVAGEMSMLVAAVQGLAVSPVMLPVKLSSEADFIPRKGQLIFENGQTELELDFTILADTSPEKDETFEIVIGNATGKAVLGARQRLVVTILSNDNAHGRVGFSMNSLRKIQPELSQDAVVAFEVVREYGHFGRVVAVWNVTGNHSVTDISPVSGQVVFDDGETTKNISITVRQDEVPELDEVVFIRLLRLTETGSTLPGRGAVLNTARTLATLIIPGNDDPHGVLSWQNVLFISQQPQLTNTTITVHLQRRGGLLGGVVVAYETVQATKGVHDKDQAAVPGVDYKAKSGQLVISAGRNTSHVTFNVMHGSTSDSNKLFYVNLTSVQLQPGSKTTQFVTNSPRIDPRTRLLEVVIAQTNQSLGAVSFNVSYLLDAQANVIMTTEGSVLLLNVIRTGSTRNRVGFHYIVQPAITGSYSPASSSDFSPSNGTVYFADGETSKVINVTILEDNKPEQDEAFYVQMSRPIDGVKIGPNSLVNVVIRANDNPYGVFGFKTANIINPIEEGRILRLEVERFGGAFKDIQVTWRITQSPNSQLTPLNGTLTFKQGSRVKFIELLAINDSIPEGAQQFTCELSAVDNGAGLNSSTRTAQIVIVANDNAKGIISIDPATRTLVVGEPVPSGYDGSFSIRILRRIGQFGRATVSWRIAVTTAGAPSPSSTFNVSSGQVIFTDGVKILHIGLHVKQDSFPEELASYSFSITNADNADRDPSPGALKATIDVVASDDPYGVIVFDPPYTYNVSESVGTVNLTARRQKGNIGRLIVNYTVTSATATAGVDYEVPSGVIEFADREDRKKIPVKIIQDNVPELVEKIVVRLDNVRLVPNRPMNYSSIGGLQLDMPPRIGTQPEVSITIEKNDDAHGVVQFTSSSKIAREADHQVSLELRRSGGTLGKVEVSFVVLNGTASFGQDYNVSNGSVVFNAGQSLARLVLPILDDSTPEHEETFTVRLGPVTGGAVLGSQVTMEVRIQASDNPRGLLGFVNSTSLVLPNPNTTQDLWFGISRVGGSEGDIQVQWRVLQVAPSTGALSDDFIGATAGQTGFTNGDKTTKYLRLRLDAFKRPEPQEVFLLNLFDATGGASIDALQSNITMTVLKHGFPNGIFAFKGIVSEPIIEPATGSKTVSFTVQRSMGAIGTVQVYWRVMGISAGANNEDLQVVSGSVTFPAGDTLQNVVLSVKADDIPELDETFLVMLYKVDGGGDIDTSAQNVTFNISANDDPHGVFKLKSGAQSLTVAGDLSRHLLFTILREKGTFGDVEVSYSVIYSSWYPDSLSGTTTVSAGSGNTEMRKDIVLLRSTFLRVGSNFQITLTRVRYVSSGSPAVVSSPSLSPTSIREVVQVPETAANAVLKISDQSRKLRVTTGNIVPEIMVVREGLYNSVIVTWRSGYPPDSLPAGFTAGEITPTTGSLTFGRNDRNKTFSVTAIPSLTPDRKLVYAVHLATTTSPTAANVTQGEGRTAVIEYSGVVEIAQNSRNLVVKEGKQVTCHVVRLFSVLGAVRVTYIAHGVSRTIDMVEGQYSKAFQLTAPDNNIPEKDSTFFINITQVTGSHSPRLGTNLTARVIVQDNDDAHGVLSFQTTSLRVSENATSGNTRTVDLIVRRTRGTFGAVSVIVRTVGGGESWDRFANPQELRDKLARRSPEANATVGNDYIQLMETITFSNADPSPSGGQVKTVSLIIRDDLSPEPDEQVYLYLANATGGARLATAADNLQSWSVVTIIGNDLMNGEVGFVTGSQSASIDEDGLASATLKIERVGSNFGSVVDKCFYCQKTEVVVWRVREVDVRPQLVEYHGTVTFGARVREVDLVIRLKKDITPEFRSTFHVDLVELQNTQEALINPSARSALITVLPSDYPYGLIGFAPEALYTPVNFKQTEVSLKVIRSQGNTTDVTVTYEAAMLPALISTEAGVSTSRAFVGQDYKQPTTQTIRFRPGVTTQTVTITLTPTSQSASSYPKAFKLAIISASSKAVVESTRSKAMVIISNDVDTTRFLALRASSRLSPLTDEAINRILADLKSYVKRPLNNDRLALTKDTIESVLKEKKKRPTMPGRRLQEITKATLMDIFDELLDPSRSDTRGRAELAQVMEMFAFSLAYGQTCPTTKSLGLKGKRAYAEVFRKTPAALNGLELKSVEGKHYFKYPANLYQVPVNPAQSPACDDVHFIEYHTSHWFKEAVVNNKVLSTSVNDSSALNKAKNPFTFVIYSGKRRVTPKGAKCVYWDFTKSVWSTSGCIVKSDKNDYVECQCNHNSNYAAQGESDDRVGYSMYFFAACFVCLGAFALALLSHHACSVENLFSAKLLMHMFFACMSAQLMYVVGAYVSSTQAVVTEDPAIRCSVLGIFIHYFYLCQFSWMFVQGWNLWRILVLNDEHTDRKYVLFFVLGWGMPVIIIVLYIVIAQAAFSWKFTDMYGDVHKNGDMCFIPNAYAAFASAVAPVLLFLMGVAVVFTQAYQVTMQWRYYDDIYRGHYNIKEVRHVIMLFTVVTLTWLFAGLHLAYGYIWMLIVFAILDIFTGMYVFILFFILRNQVRGVFKRSYAFQGEPPPIQTHDDFFRGQQGSLERSSASSKRQRPRQSPDDPIDWDGDIGATPRSNRKLLVNLDDSESLGGRVNDTFEDDIENQDFDDLIFALKTGGYFDPAREDEKDMDGDLDLGQGEEHYEMRRISIPDTHL